MKTKTKFKQTLSAILVAVLMLCTLSACGGNKNIGESEKNSQNAVVNTGKKIKGKIINFLGYSNGFALVELDNDDEKAYCIDKSGNIVYQLDIESGSFAWKRFINGMTITDGGICNLNGKIVYPEDMGVKSFYTFALDGGYIIATKITADYSSSKKEMGVLNTDFEWVIEPSETLFAEFEEDLDTSLSTESGYYNGIIYFGMSDKFLNVETGEVLEKIMLS